MDFLISKNVKAIIIACGTATSQALNVVQNLYSIPIIGIIEPTVNYIVEKSNFLGKNSLIKPFVFSLVPLCHEL